MEDRNTSRVAHALLKVAGVLLLLIWIASMPVADDRLCSPVPLCFGMAVVILLAVVAMVLGARPPRPTLTCVLGLLAGLYFCIRCAAGDMLSEIWRETPLLLAAFVFYGAGYCCAQKRGGMILTNALLLGVVLNAIYLFLLRNPSIPLEVSGRPEMTMAGANSRGTALFVYKNFAGVFLMVAGALLMLRPLWVGWKGRGSLIVFLAGAAGVACSLLTHSRMALGIAPLLAVLGWGLWAIIRLYSGQRMGVGAALVGVVLLVGCSVMVGELFIGDSLVRRILAVDTHVRSHIWESIIYILPQVPWCGHGAGATQWQLVPWFVAAMTPNYAHNEYLQAWVDYGLVGACLVVFVVLIHLASGFWSLASEEAGRGRRALLSACMLLLCALAVSALTDFMWHSFALVGLSAFACGVLASPVPQRNESLFSRRKWAPGSGPALRPVRFMGRGLAAVTCVLCVLVATICMGLGWRLLPAWCAQWQYNARCYAGASDGERVEFLEQAVNVCPDPALADHYVTLRPPPGRSDNRQRMENVLRLAYQSNPHQLYTAVMLAEVLGLQGKCAEAEAVLRDSYAPGGQPAAMFVNWPGYYGMNLLTWGRQRMVEGDYASALSMMEYALNIWGHSGGFKSTRLNAGKFQRRLNENSDVFVAARQIDVDMLKLIGVQKDDSWQQPMRPGGPSALYARWGLQACGDRAMNPYTRSSPLNRQKK